MTPYLDPQTLRDSAGDVTCKYRYRLRAFQRINSESGRDSVTSL